MANLKISQLLQIEFLLLFVNENVCVMSLPSCLTLCDPMEHSPPDSSVHGILQTRIVEWVAIPSPGDLPDLEIESTSLMSPALAVRFFTTSATWETLNSFSHGP